MQVDSPSPPFNTLLSIQIFLSNSPRLLIDSSNKYFLFKFLFHSFFNRVSIIFILLFIIIYSGISDVKCSSFLFFKDVIFWLFCILFEYDILDVFIILNILSDDIYYKFIFNLFIIFSWEMVHDLIVNVFCIFQLISCYFLIY